jgi:hypothetical protein
MTYFWCLSLDMSGLLCQWTLTLKRLNILILLKWQLFSQMAIKITLYYAYLNKTLFGNKLAVYYYISKIDTFHEYINIINIKQIVNGCCFSRWQPNISKLRHGLPRYVKFLSGLALGFLGMLIVSLKP